MAEHKFCDMVHCDYIRTTDLERPDQDQAEYQKILIWDLSGNPTDFQATIIFATQPQFIKNVRKWFFLGSVPKTEKREPLKILRYAGISIVGLNFGYFFQYLPILSL